MPRLAYRFEMDAAVSLTEAEMSLHLAMIALEGLYGPAGVRLDARYHLDEAGRAIVVDGSTALGESLVRIFAALLIREFGDESFQVGRLFTTGSFDAADSSPPLCSRSAEAAA